MPSTHSYSCIFPVLNRKIAMTRALRRSSDAKPRPWPRLIDRAQLLLRQPLAVACHEALQVADLGDLAGELADVAGGRGAAPGDDAEGIAERTGIHCRAVGRRQGSDGSLIAGEGQRGSPIEDGARRVLVELALAHARRPRPAREGPGR